jgi:hypothetical protein
MCMTDKVDFISKELTQTHLDEVKKKLSALGSFNGRFFYKLENGIVHVQRFTFWQTLFQQIANIFQRRQSNISIEGKWHLLNLQNLPTLTTKVQAVAAPSGQGIQAQVLPRTINEEPRQVASLDGAVNNAAESTPPPNSGFGLSSPATLTPSRSDSSAEVKTLTVEQMQQIDAAVQKIMEKMPQVVHNQLQQCDYTSKLSLYDNSLVKFPSITVDSSTFTVFVEEMKKRFEEKGVEFHSIQVERPGMFSNEYTFHINYTINETDRADQHERKEAITTALDETFPTALIDLISSLDISNVNQIAQEERKKLEEESQTAFQEILKRIEEGSQTIGREIPITAYQKKYVRSRVMHKLEDKGYEVKEENSRQGVYISLKITKYPLV